MVWNEGKVVNGRWTPGRLNALLGRQLECGQQPWWKNAVRELLEMAEWNWYRFRYYILLQKWDYDMWDDTHEIEDHAFYLWRKDAEEMVAIAKDVYPDCHAEARRVKF